MALQVQWSLDSTSSSALSISRGLLQAATGDNVQPLALLACEKFGSIIAMCQETCRKIEGSVLPTPSPAILHFIQGTVGYSRDDCATHLGKSLAGVQFLGLAAALVTTMGEFEASNALLLMMRGTAADKTLHPTAKQLRDLLSSLEKRLNRSGFANSVVGWSWIPCPGTTSYPSAEAIEKLVDAFGRLHRIGETTVMKVTVRVKFCAPWVIAFTTWCLGMPPSVYLEDGTIIIEQPKAEVVIIICTDTTQAEDDKMSVVTIHHSIGNPEKLIAIESHKPWAGMVTIEYYGQWILQEYNLDQEDARRALEQCLPYAAKEFLEQCRFTSGLASSNSSQVNQDPIFQTRRQRDTARKRPARDPSTIEEFRTVPFRGDSSVADILSRMLDTKTTVDLTRLDSGYRVTDLPLVKLHLESLKKECSCPLCRIPSTFEIQAPSRGCLKDEFLYNAALILSDALALSLFDCPEGLLVRIENGRERRRNDFYTAVHYIFSPTAATGSLMRPDSIPYCEIGSLLDWALMLVGHNVGMEMSASHWAMSCFKGQAVYPTIFDTFRIKKRGYLALSWLPGILEFRGEKYEIVKDYADIQQAPARRDNIASSEEVCRPLNSYPSYSLKWRVSAKDDFLELGVYLEGSPVEILRNPLKIINTLACSLVFERCPHNRDAELQSADLFCAYTSPLHPENHHGGKTSVVAVDGADHLRFYSLGGVGRNTVPMVMRIDACLECCLAVCRKADCSILVL
ncbi:hypothetical protein VE03_06101 [Pseudogymnoascus sp. 23342-1-I1]|nr:hypothetical protein VE03_06101 [Pseudogymnoascus sp. 23342-1-I1]